MLTFECSLYSKHCVHYEHSALITDFPLLGCVVQLSYFLNINELKSGKQKHLLSGITGF